MKELLKILLLLGFVLSAQIKAEALEVLYPQKNPYRTSSSVTYIMGNAQVGSKLTVNGCPVKVWKNGAYCKTVNLKDGENKFNIKEISNYGTKVLVYHINKTTCPAYVPPKKMLQPQKPKITKFTNNSLMLAYVITDGAPVRDNASESATRITHLPLNTIILLEGKLGKWFKIYNGKTTDPLWIYSKNANILYPVNNPVKSGIRDVKFSEDDDFSYMEITLELPVAYKMNEINDNIELTIYGIKNENVLIQKATGQKIFLGFNIQNCENGNMTVEIPSANILWGYDASYDGNTLIFKKRKTPVINYSHPLKGLTIAIDPGHGGKEPGAIGPTRVSEKDINLDISLKLQRELEKQGAKVVMTRTTDEYVDIYRRPEIANLNNAIICLSIHSNSVVDQDPYEKHGISTFYYHAQAKELAQVIKLQMIKDLKLKDDWHRNASFVLTRPTMPVSVLIEVAYMPNPEEYLHLTDEHFRKKAAQSISEGLKEYLRKTIKSDNYGVFSD